METQQNKANNPHHEQYRHIYPSWSSFTDAVKGWSTIRNKAVKYNAYGASHSDESAQTTPWSGAHTYDDALSWLDNGWKDGLDMIRRVQRTIPPDLFDCIMPIQDYKPELRHQISGGTLDVGQFIAGCTPENFVAEVVPHEGEVKQQGKKLITVYMQSFNSCGCSHDAYMYRGAYTFSMVEHLENCGYSVELWTVHYNRSTGNEKKQRIYVKVKEFGELFDTNKLAIALCSPAFMRRFIFALQETYGDEECEAFCCHSYGYPIESKDVSDVALPEDQDLNPIWIGMVNVERAEETLKQYRKILDDYVSGDVFSA